jgi:ribosomal protein S18 acetylase RimI-like enzyme
MPAYTFLPLRPRDFKKLDAQRKKIRGWKRQARRGNRQVFVCLEDGAFIAQGDLVYDAHDPDYTIPGQRVYISRVRVEPERRGQGIGTAMVAFLCEEARRQGFSEISLGVNKDNAVALHVYEKAGFDTLLFDGEDQWGAYVKLLRQL